MKGFQKLTTTDEALRKWLSALQIKKPTAEAVPLGDALNRVLVESVVADENLPRFDKSAVDGYAVSAEATLGASQFRPALLKLIASEVVGGKQAKQVWTGNPIPKGADAVVMIENTQKRGDGVEVWMQLAPGDNVSKRGEDVKKSETVIEAGTRLNPYHLGLLAAFGRSKISVAKKPRIAILATGNELVGVGSKPAANQIYDPTEQCSPPCAANSAPNQ